MKIWQCKGLYKHGFTMDSLLPYFEKGGGEKPGLDPMFSILT